jgi:hypothetical protein
MSPGGFDPRTAVLSMQPQAQYTRFSPFPQFIEFANIHATLLHGYSAETAIV